MHYKRLKFIACLGLIIIPAVLFSQQKKDSVKHKILLVPFKPTMFMNAIGKAVNKKTHLGYGKITDAFRLRMDIAIYNAFKQDYPTISLLQSPKPGDTTLSYIYNSIGYNYDLLPGDSSDESHEEFDPKLQKKHFINKGQLQVPIDYSKRFMNTHILNPALLTYLYKKYGTDVIAFVNEVDIENVSNSTTEDLTQSNYRRLVTVHYSILNIRKHYLARGLLSAYFPYTENDPKVIGEKYFSVIAGAMMTALYNGLQKADMKKSKKKAGK